MARPQRNNVDYFPFLCEDGNKMFYLEETYGNDGFAVFVKLLRELAKTDFHYLDLSKSTTKMFLSAKCKVSKDVLESIIKDLVDLEKFDRELWNENSIIWCQDFIDSIQDAYSKRSNSCIDRKSLLLLLISKGIRKQSKQLPKPIKLPSTSPVNTQSIVEDSIEDKNIYFTHDSFLIWFKKCREHIGLKYNAKSLTMLEKQSFNSLKLYTIDDFKLSFSNFSRAKYYIENDLLMPINFLKEETFIKYLNQPIKKELTLAQKLGGMKA